MHLILQIFSEPWNDHRVSKNDLRIYSKKLGDGLEVFGNATMVGLYDRGLISDIWSAVVSVAESVASAVVSAVEDAASWLVSVVEDVGKSLASF